MLMLFLILIFRFSYANEDYVCHVDTTDTPPFYISDEYKQGNRYYENLRNLDDPDQVDTYLPRGSIVYIPPSFEELDTGENSRRPVKVLGTPKKEHEDRLDGQEGRKDDTGKYQHKRFKALGAGKKGKTRAKYGDVGYIHKNSLIKASKYTYRLKEDSKLFKTPAGKVLKGRNISFSMKDGKFQISRCCTPDTFEFKDVQETCFDDYKFKVETDDGALIGEYFTDQVSCSIFESLVPIENEIIEPMGFVLNQLRIENPGLSIGDLELIRPQQQWTGRKKPKKLRPLLVKIPVDPITNEGPFGSLHYNRDDKYSSDAFMHPTSLCGFNEALKKFSKQCTTPGCQVQFGDMYHSADWKVHSSHKSGECVDIRPLKKKNNGDWGITYKDKSQYDRKKTEMFIRTLKDAGAGYIVFNDPKIKTYISRDKEDPGKRRVHDDHIHVCFRKNSEKVKKACRDGIK